MTKTQVRQLYQNAYANFRRGYCAGAAERSTTYENLDGAPSYVAGYRLGQAHKVLPEQLPAEVWAIALARYEYGRAHPYERPLRLGG